MCVKQQIWNFLLPVTDCEMQIKTHQIKTEDNQACKTEENKLSGNATIEILMALKSDNSYRM